MRDAFEKFMNRRDNKPAELIAKFMDAKLRGSGGGGASGSGGRASSAAGTDTEAALESALDRALALFRFIQVCAPAHLRRAFLADDVGFCFAFTAVRAAL